MQTLRKNELGLAHVGLIVLAVFLIGAIGFAGYRVMNKDKSSDSALSSADQKAAEKECNKDMDDKDLCKFLSSWSSSQKYRIISTDTIDGKTVKSTFELDGDNSRISISDQSYETITIGKTFYTKAGSTWYKQTAKDTEEDLTGEYKKEFDEPTTESGSDDSKTSYKKLGKEACGNLQCFKYEVVSSGTDKQIIWFDDNDYLLRRSTVETSEGTSEQTYEYDNIDIREPSPVKELGPNQYIIPGQSEPTTIPSL